MNQLNRLIDKRVRQNQKNQILKKRVGQRTKAITSKVLKDLSK